MTPESGSDQVLDSRSDDRKLLALETTGATEASSFRAAQGASGRKVELNGPLAAAARTAAEKLALGRKALSPLEIAATEAIHNQPDAGRDAAGSGARAGDRLPGRRSGAGPSRTSLMTLTARPLRRAPASRVHRGALRQHGARPAASNQTGTNTFTSFASSVTSSAAAGPWVTGWSAWKKFAVGIRRVALSPALSRLL